MDRGESVAQGGYRLLSSPADSNATTIQLQGPLTADSLRALASRGPLHTLSIHDDAVFGLRQARELLALPGIDWLRLFCPVTRAAASVLLEVPGLRVLDMFEARSGGTLRGFDVARGLERFHWSWHALQPTDFAAIAQSPTLRALGTDHSVITPAALDALLAMPRLQWLSLESSTFDDVLASRLRTGTPLRSLFLAGNPHFTISHWAATEPFRDNATLAHFLDGYRKAGLPE